MEDRDDLNNKAACLKKLFSIQKISIRKKEIPFNVIFFSNDLESVFHLVDGGTISDDEKKILSRSLLTKYKIDNEILEKLINDNNIKVCSSFQECYENIIDYQESSTNFNLLIEDVIKSLKE